MHLITTLNAAACYSIRHLTLCLGIFLNLFFYSDATHQGIRHVSKPFPSLDACINIKNIIFLQFQQKQT